MGELAQRLSFELRTPNTGGLGTSIPPQSVAPDLASDPLVPSNPAPVQPEPRAPTLEAETVEKLIEANQKLEASAKDRRDFMPFKWYEVLISLVLGALTAYGGIDMETGEITTGSLWLDFLSTTFLSLLIMAMLIFPFRYYFRGRRVWRAIRYYAISVFILIIAVGIFMGIHPDIMDETMGTGENLAAMLFGSVLVFGFIAGLTFCTYGLMHFQRTQRIFNRHVETL